MDECKPLPPMPSRESSDTRRCSADADTDTTCVRAALRAAAAAARPAAAEAATS